jgi:hypothetical protein
MQRGVSSGVREKLTRKNLFTTTDTKDTTSGLVRRRRPARQAVVPFVSVVVK